MTRGSVRPQQLLVIHDDLDLPLGRLRLRSGGSSGGQRGVQDTIRAIGPDFWRLKVGISGTPAGWETTNWVLSRFQPGERELLDRVISLAADAVELALREGPEAAANHYNGADLRELPGGANSG
jgi:PTH1 family peptidyl-tRNA hydrolase